MRTTSSRVRFQNPFVLQGQTCPAGEYLVETDEEALDAMETVGYRRSAVFVHVPSPSGAMQIFTVTPAEFDEALRRDRSTSAR